MRCRACGNAQPIGLSYVCPACFGPLEVEYDYAVVGATLTREAIAARGARHLALRGAAPGRRAADARPAGRLDAVAGRRAAGPELGLDRLWIKDDTRNPSLSFKDRAVAVAAARAVEFGVEALACASTGNLAGATAAAAAALGLPAYVFIPADLEPAKVDHALAYGATVVPIEGTYDDVNRLCLEVADETGWGFVNINLRPFYAEGSKTLAYEIAESLGWRSPDVVVAPGGIGGDVHPGRPRVRGARRARADRATGRSASSVARRPAARRWRRPGRPAPRSSSRSGRRTRSFARWPSATRPTVRTPSRWRNGSGGSIEAIDDEVTAAAIRDVARLEGIYPETAGGVTLAAAAAARRRGVIRPGDEVVALLTGNGLKTPDARTLGHGDGIARPGQPGLAPAIRPSLSAFESWLEGERMSTVRIPPTLRVATGGAKQVQVPGGTVREVVAGSRRAPPGARVAAPGARRRPEPLRQRVPQRHRRPPPPGARHAGRRGATRWSSCPRWPAANALSPCGRSRAGQPPRARLAFRIGVLHRVGQRPPLLDDRVGGHRARSASRSSPTYS